MQDEQMKMLNSVIEQSEGNPGASMALISCLNFGQNFVLDRLKELEIKGADIYVLFSDLCGKDAAKVFHLLLNCPADKLKDACSRQDWSGQAIVEPYLTNFKTQKDEN